MLRFEFLRQDELTRDLSVDYPREMEANYPHDIDSNFPRDMDAQRPRDMDVRQFGGILFGVRDEGNAGVHKQGSIDLAPQKA